MICNLAQTLLPYLQRSDVYVGVREDFGGNI